MCHVSPASTRRTTAAVVTVWVLGLLLVLGLWQGAQASCGDEGAAQAAGVCVTDADTGTTGSG
jgi:hypothetical protein